MGREEEGEKGDRGEGRRRREEVEVRHQPLQQWPPPWVGSVAAWW